LYAINYTTNSIEVVFNSNYGSGFWSGGFRYPTISPLSAKITCDDSGQYSAFVLKNDNIYTNDASGVGNYTQHIIGGGNLQWTDITSDSTGKYLAAVVFGGNIWTNDNYGADLDWNERIVGGSGKQWNGIASDSTGQYLAAVVYGGGIWISRNGGSTWTQTASSSPYNWSCIVSSDNGNKLAAGISSGNICTSININDDPLDLNQIFEPL
jgi:hypothetical protein